MQNKNFKKKLEGALHRIKTCPDPSRTKVYFEQQWKMSTVIYTTSQLKNTGKSQHILA